MTKFRAYYNKTISAFTEYEVPDDKPEKAYEIAEGMIDTGIVPAKLTYIKDEGWQLVDISPVEEK